MCLTYIFGSKARGMFGYVRFTDQIERTETCWKWTGVRFKGYGLYRTPESQIVMAHRASYEHYVGPIPYNLQIDHVCRNRYCVNPAHLEAVTPKENTRRMREAYEQDVNE